MFITFRQNNSGGYFIRDENIDVFVIIEGDNLNDILNRAKDVFMDYREYCMCCGKRWDDDWKNNDDLTQIPMIDDESIYEFNDSYYEGDKIIVYRKDGTKETVEL